MMLGDEVVQDSTTAQLIFDIPQLIEHLSKFGETSPGGHDFYRNATGRRSGEVTTSILEAGRPMPCPDRRHRLARQPMRCGKVRAWPPLPLANQSSPVDVLTLDDWLDVRQETVGVDRISGGRLQGAGTGVTIAEVGIEGLHHSLSQILCDDR